MNRPGFAGGSQLLSGWSHDEQDHERIFTRGPSFKYSERLAEAGIEPSVGEFL